MSRNPTRTTRGRDRVPVAPPPVWGAAPRQLAHSRAAPRPTAPRPTKPLTPPAQSGQALWRRWWLALSDPSVRAFDLLQLSAGWSGTLASLLVAGVIGGIAYNLRQPGRPSPLAAVLWGALGGAISALVAFMLGAGVLQLVARAFGGTGTFRRYGYLLTLFVCPLTVIAVVAGFVPLLGSVVATLAMLYGIVLAIVATVSAHRLALARAVGAMVVGMVALAVVLVASVVVVVILAVVQFAFHL